MAMYVPTRSAPPTRVDRPRASTEPATATAATMAATSIGRKASASGWSAQERSTMTGIRKPATCALEASAISVASLICPRLASRTALPCSAALPASATTTPRR
jgi:hypothetical protein